MTGDSVVAGGDVDGVDVGLTFDIGALDFGAVLDGEGPDAASVSDAESIDSAADAGRECAEERCNQRDDDCDGLIDESACPEPVCPEVVVTPPPAALGLDPFYTQYVDAGGIPIISRDGVPPAAFRVAYYVLAEMLDQRPCFRRSMIDSGLRVGLFGPNDVTTDFPEYSDFYEVFPGTDWDQRGRGFGATLTRPLSTVGYENLLRLESDLWFGESILIHEWAHTYFEFGVREQVGGLEQQARLDVLYDSAMQRGLWADTYAATNSAEYWAEAVQSYFNTNLASDPSDGVHNQIDTRPELLEYDPEMAAFIQSIFPPRDWPPYCRLEGDGPAWRDPTPQGVDGAQCEPRYHSVANVGCDLQVGSESSDVPVELIFVNRRVGESLTIEWINYEGQAQSFIELPPRSTAGQRTFQTHPWRIIDGQGACVGVFITPGHNGRIILE
jgi:hypothetical protein